MCESSSAECISVTRRIWVLQPTLSIFPSRKHAYIMMTPLKPHFYIVKLGFTGVDIIFHISAQNIDFQAGYHGFESRSGRDNVQTISTPSSYSTCPGLTIKWTGRRLVTDSGTKCAWVIHESKAVQIHVHNNRRCFCVPRVPGSVKNPHNNNLVLFNA